MFARELCIWAQLQHENILSLIGIVTVDGMPGLASEWIEGGTMNDYLKKHKNTDIRRVVRVVAEYPEFNQLIALVQVWGIACGLEYLHSMGVVHSDLKGVSTSSAMHARLR